MMRGGCSRLLPRRFERFGLSIHPEKTRLLDFRKPSLPARKGRSTFDFLGFRHYWARSLRGYWVVKAKTAAPRLRRALTRVGEWCRVVRHEPIPWQHEQLCRKMLGHYAYYAIPCNQRCLGAFYQEVMRIWRKWLCRRSRASRMNWDTFNRLLATVPVASPPGGACLHVAKRYGEEPCAVIPLARVCGRPGAKAPGPPGRRQNAGAKSPILKTIHHPTPALRRRKGRQERIISRFRPSDLSVFSQSTHAPPVIET